MTVVFLFVGCAKMRTEPWPAAIVSISGFSSEEETSVRSALTDLNQSSGKIALLVEGESAKSAFPISISKREPPPDAPNRAGLSTFDEIHCAIEISPKVFTVTYQSYLKSVIWHEVGHCGGLVHTTKLGALMYPTTEPFFDYSKGDLSDFLAALFSAAGLK
ncbi:MAG: matrixin family metalloprotease [Deltaproteobacteria bacterium]|nr:matrixin family metalloprotease [Deltaproteobacteria bacterium]